jgi:hypothetical protein
MMLVHDFLQVPLGFDEVRAMILRDTHALVDANAAEAYRRGEELWLRLQPLRHHAPHGRRMWVDVGEPRLRGDGLVLPLHWWTKGMTHLFSALDADLDMVPVGPDTTQLTLSGRYDPPTGGGVQEPDRSLLHRLAEATVRSFLQRIGASLADARIPIDTASGRKLPGS